MAHWSLIKMAMVVCALLPVNAHAVQMKNTMAIDESTNFGANHVVRVRIENIMKMCKIIINSACKYNTFYVSHSSCHNKLLLHCKAEWQWVYSTNLFIWGALRY